MAITNAQQYQQLVNPPMKGKKRPGYRGDDAARSDAASGRNAGRADPSGGVERGDGGNRDQRRETQYTRPPNVTKKEFKDRLERARDFRGRTIGSKINRGLTNFRNKNIKRFIDNSIRKDLYRSGFVPNAFKGINIPTTLGIAAETGYSMFGPEVDLFDKDSLREIASTLTNTGGSLTKSQSKALESFGKNIANRDEFLEEGMTQKRFEELYPKPTVDDRDGPQDPCRGPNPPAYCFTGIRSAAPVVEEEEPEYVNPLSLLSPRIAGSQFAAEGGRIGLRGGDAARSDAASGRNAGRADPGGGVEDKSNDGQTAINDASIMMARMQNQNLNSITNPKFTQKFSKTSPIFSNFNKIALNKMIADMNLNTITEEDEDTNAIGAVFDTGLPENVSLGTGLAEKAKQDIMNQKNTFEKALQTSLGYNMGGRAGLAGGGIASLEDMDREGFLLGGIAKGLKKAVKGVKRLAKSPIGKAALGFAAFQYGGGLGGIMDKFNSLSKLQKFGVGVGVPSILAGLITPKEDEDKFDIDSYYASSQLDPSQSIRGMGSEFDFYGGQRIASAEGGATDKEPVAKKVMPLIDMDGKEKDYRETGGFVDMGRMEKADDVPARLSKNEFVFTADAVRNAGDGSIDKGSEVMYNMMKNLESGGDVSEESQGLEGARKMFQTSQRLEEVL